MVAAAGAAEALHPASASAAGAAVVAAAASGAEALHPDAIVGYLLEGCVDELLGDVADGAIRRVRLWAAMTCQGVVVVLPSSRVHYPAQVALSVGAGGTSRMHAQVTRAVAAGGTIRGRRWHYPWPQVALSMAAGGTIHGRRWHYLWAQVACLTEKRPELGNAALDATAEARVAVLAAILGDAQRLEYDLRVGLLDEALQQEVFELVGGLVRGLRDACDIVEQITWRGGLFL